MERVWLQLLMIARRLYQASLYSPVSTHYRHKCLGKTNTTQQVFVQSKSQYALN